MDLGGSKISKFLKKQQADVICLAEVDTGSIRNRFFCQMKKMAKKLNFKYYSSASKYHPHSIFKFVPLIRKHHDAIISRIRGVKKKHYLKSGKSKLVQEYVVNNISVFTVHLGLLRKRLRRIQMKELSEILKKCPRSFVICGDFNIFNGLNELKTFLKEANVRRINIPASFPSCNPKRQLDLFLASPGINVLKFGAIKTEYSDHLPVWVKIGV